MRQHAFRSVAAIALVGLVSGCGCKDCDPTWSPEQPRKLSAFHRTVAPAAYQTNTQAVDPNKRFTDPATVAALIGQLAAQRDYIGRLIADASQEVQNIASEMQKSVQIVLNDLDGMMKDHTDRTFEQLNELERRTFRHAVIVSQKMADSMRALEVAAFEDAKVLLAETAITAYEVEYNLPCRDKVARVVYARPASIIVWPDARGPSTDIIELRGNYLQNMAGRTVSLSGFPSQPASIDLPVFAANQNGVSVKLNETAINALKSVARPTTLKLSAPYKYCKHTKDVPPLEGQFLATPAKQYEVFTWIAPVATIPITSQLVRHYHNSTGGKCDRDFADSATYPIVAPAEISGQPTYHIQGHRCGSHVTNFQAQTRRSVTIDTRIRGCGYNWLANCKGNGYLDAAIYIPIKTSEKKELAPSEDVRTILQDDKIVVPYKIDYPANMEGDPSCRYYVRVKEPNSDRVIEFNESSDDSGGIIHSPDARCNLSLTFPARFTRS